MKTLTAIAFIALAVMFIAPDAGSPQGVLTREDKLRILCGENAAWVETEKPGEIQCFTKRGHKTIKKIVP
jgi:hypothetical protein